MALWLVVLAVVSSLQCGVGAVACNEYDTCLPGATQLNISMAVREGNNGHACRVVRAAVRCLEEAKQDCEDGYRNLPQYILHGLDTKRANLTANMATYCGTNGGDVTAVSVTVTVGWTVLVCAVLCAQ